VLRVRLCSFLYISISCFHVGAILRSVADKLQRVLNAAALLVSGTRKYDRGLSQILHADLH